MTNELGTQKDYFEQLAIKKADARGALSEIMRRMKLISPVWFHDTQKQFKELNDFINEA